MIQAKNCLRGAIVSSIIGLTIVAAQPARAGAVTASVVASGNRFVCDANGTMVPISGPFWRWQVYIDGSLVDSGYNHTTSGIPWVATTLSVHAVEPAGMDLHGYHTCRFVGDDIGGSGNVSKNLWDQSAIFTFP